MACKPRLMLCQRSDFYESKYYSLCFTRVCEISLFIKLEMTVALIPLFERI